MRRRSNEEASGRRGNPFSPFVLFLAGPTAVGKTGLAVRLAKKIDAEIVSCDSMQVYRGMDIGTAKPTWRERRGIPHHCIDIADPRRGFDASKYRAKALVALRNIARAKKNAVVVGGTGLYMKALLEGLFAGPGADAALRARLEKQAAAKGKRWLHARLRRCDPVSARRIHPNNVRRVIRALEVFGQTRKPISALQGAKAGKGFPYPYRVVALDMPRAQLYSLVDARVRRMFRRGLKKEVEGLLGGGVKSGSTALQAIGYKEVVAWLGGLYGKARAMELVARNSRRLAKRQFTWFRRDGRIAWVPASIEAGNAVLKIAREAGCRMRRKQ